MDGSIATSTGIVLQNKLHLGMQLVYQRHTIKHLAWL